MGSATISRLTVSELSSTVGHSAGTMEVFTGWKTHTSGMRSEAVL